MTFDFLNKNTVTNFAKISNYGKEFHANWLKLFPCRIRRIMKSFPCGERLIYLLCIFYCQLQSHIIDVTNNYYETTYF